MPMYEVEHACVLTPSQKDDIAEAITKIHSEQFTAPRTFVNVRFTDISEQYTYVAGKRVGLSCAPLALNNSHVPFSEGTIA